VVALIPPVSGGDFRLTGEPLSLDAVVAEVRRDEAGAIATFLGTVRNRSRDRDVLYLEYEAYEGMAEETMSELAAELSARHDLSAVAIHHRIGRVEIGEPSVAIAVSSPHRAAALAACQEAIDTLKQTVPLWKKEVYEGGEEWIGQGS
jgi:molybdopterin synthase catalytic subunit